MGQLTRQELGLMEVYRLNETQWGALVAAFAKSERRKMGRKKCVGHAADLLGQLAGIVKPESIGPWLNTKVKAFDGATPLELIARGQAGRIDLMIEDLGSGNPS